MTEIYADGADFQGILAAAENPRVTGFTTNPTLMRVAGITDYQQFAKDIMRELKVRRPETNISLEVFADDYDGMVSQARTIHQWAQEIGYRTYIKIPITNTLGVSSADVVRTLTAEGVPCNITAVFTSMQVKDVLPAITPTTPIIISVFCGRIADAGYDPVNMMRRCIVQAKDSRYAQHQIKFLWASPREIYNYVQAINTHADIITMTPDLIKKLSGLEKDLHQFSLETVQMFARDAQASHYTIG